MTWVVSQNVRHFDAEYEEAVVACLRRGWVTEGPVAKRFEEMLREVTGANHVLLAPNGTLALYMVLRAAGIGPGDEVIVPDITFIASATSVLMAGATPVFADVDDRGLLTNEAVATVTTARTRAVMPVHLFGFVAPFWSDGVLMIEDACQALGALPREQNRIQALSFYADKAFTTSEGGAVATSDDALAEKMRYLRNQGRLDRGSFTHPEIGINLRMTDLQCALGVVELNRFEAISMARRRIWSVYARMLDFFEEANILVPPSGQENTFIPFRTVLMFRDPVALAVCATMRRRGVVEPREMFLPLHQQPCFASMHCGGNEMFPNAAAFRQRGLLLPCWPAMTDEQVAIVVREVIESYREATS